jgi:acetyltransferase-like isoleucine patch superfamily enzyme/acyl carrier protein
VSQHDTVHAARVAWEAVRALPSFARARYELRGAKLGRRVRCYGPLVVRGRRGIHVLSRAVFLGGMLPTELACEDGAELFIGPGCVFNYGVSIVARESVRVGAACRFGSLVQIRDDDGRRRAPVVIEDDVWLAHGAIVEPGATIGRRSVISAGAVVRGVIPPDMLATGNPAVFAPLGPAESTSARRPTHAAAKGRGCYSRHEVRAAIIEWLDDTRHFGEAERLVTSDSMSLRDGGLLDSLGLVQLVLMLEQRFAVEIDRDVVARVESHSMRALVDLVVDPPEQGT